MTPVELAYDAPNAPTPPEPYATPFTPDAGPVACQAIPRAPMPAGTVASAQTPVPVPWATIPPPAALSTQRPAVPPVVSSTVILVAVFVAPARIAWLSVAATDAGLPSAPATDAAAAPSAAARTARLERGAES